MSSKENMLRCLNTLSDRQKDSLDLFARNINRKREPHVSNEKITSSTIIRCLIDVFMERWDKMDMEDICQEEELLLRIKALFPPLPPG